jgi:hypothetical protein
MPGIENGASYPGHPENAIPSEGKVTNSLLAAAPFADGLRRNIIPHIFRRDRRRPGDACDSADEWRAAVM